MNITKVSSSGYVIEFNQDTGFGFIQEDTTKRVLLVQLNSFKRHSRRYINNENQYIGELFDFDILVKQKSDDDGNDTLEAVNVRHRVLKCNVEGCPRIKAFTNVKALEDHINIRHTSKKKTEETSQSSLILAKKPKKKRRPRPEPIVISLSSHTTAATIGRFIGKQGVNLKRIEQQNQVKLQLLNSRKAYNPLQVLMKPTVGITVDIKSVSKKLKFEWERCVLEQQVHENIREERLKLIYSPRQSIVLEFEGDSRYRTDSKFLYVRQLKQQDMLRRRIYRQTESSVRVQERHSSLNQEGHRSAATCGSEYRQKSIFNYFQPKKIKKSMKEKHWLINEQLQALE
ncbi:unnamed protein product [Rotaria sp. Silwood2]|nr:unnamed protein product [Rotaria sp. Silwood2]